MALLEVPTITQRVFTTRLPWPARLMGLLALALGAFIAFYALSPGLQLTDDGGWSRTATLFDRVLILLPSTLLFVLSGLYFFRNDAVIDTGTREVISRVYFFRWRISEERSKFDTITHIEFKTAAGHLGPFEYSYHKVALAAGTKWMWSAVFLGTALHGKTFFVSHERALAHAYVLACDLEKMLKLEVKVVGPEQPTPPES
ncbi:MAG TPA: hypothetical protein VEJ63_02830 [Planctomycetota bacterium]|nr:hypothetical protein [Planctomycetota bacterium]